MPQPTVLQPVTITAQHSAPNDDVSLLIGGRRWSGWTNVRITRGIERLPSDFELHLTEFSPTKRAIQSALQIRRSPHEHSLSGVNLASEIP